MNIQDQLNVKINSGENSPSIINRVFKFPNKIVRIIKEKKPVLFILIILMVIGIGAYWAIYLRGNDKKSFTQVCSDELLVRGNTILRSESVSFDVVESSRSDELFKLSNEIKQLVNFDQDPNCVLILIHSSISFSDSESARMYYEKIKAPSMLENLNPKLIQYVNKDDFLNILDRDISSLAERNDYNLKNYDVLNAEGN